MKRTTKLSLFAGVGFLSLLTAIPSANAQPPPPPGYGGVALAADIVGLVRSCVAPTYVYAAPPVTTVYTTPTVYTAPGATVVTTPSYTYSYYNGYYVPYYSGWYYYNNAWLWGRPGPPPGPCPAWRPGPRWGGPGPGPGPRMHHGGGPGPGPRMHHGGGPGGRGPGGPGGPGGRGPGGPGGPGGRR